MQELSDEDWEDLEADDASASEKTILADIVTDRGQEPLRIDKFLMNRIEGATRNKLQQAMEEGMILLNGLPVKANQKVKAGDHIIVYDNRHPESTVVHPEKIPLQIVYEDDYVLVINKNAGMVVHPGSGNYCGTLVNGLAYYLQKTEEEIPRIGLVHRIDKDTSGLILIAKDENSMQKLAVQFKQHTVHRRYVALVWGNVEADEGTIQMNVGRHQRFRKIMTTYPDADRGKHAITHYTVLQRFHYVTLVELRLETGRTHQIRVHMKSIGHPLFNDETYGGSHIVKGTVFNRYKQFIDNCFKTLPRQALHAKELGFVHPYTGEQVLFDSELPDDFQNVLKKWESYITGIQTGKGQLRDGI